MSSRGSSLFSSALRSLAQLCTALGYPIHLCAALRCASLHCATRFEPSPLFSSCAALFRFLPCAALFSALRSPAQLCIALSYPMQLCAALCCASLRCATRFLILILSSSSFPALLRFLPCAALFSAPCSPAQLRIAL